MAIRSLLAALLAVAAVTAAGCGGEDEDPVEGTGYTYSVPDGWEDASDSQAAEEAPEVTGVRFDSLVNGAAEDGFAVNVNVLRERVPGGITASEYAQLNIATLRDPSAAGYPPELAERIEELDVRGLSRPRELELAGAVARTWDYTTTQGGRDMRQRQMVVVRNGAGYTITLTALPSQFEDGTEALDEVVESWSWR
jgi:hypothetical protein